ncbi:Cholesterol 7-desaturase like protein [Argiope bruennichi]|uniref:cholesterol 7-desaturase n=1 Tax=Argiope bruennichi TaxID=94029 RepID=A0A8T0FIQ2_ARGBR|nr:Cholesterol 7-desaturase like protein [Argiope bruennichi]
MSDEMAICLSDVLNDSCFPRTLGSEAQPSYIPDISDVGVFEGFLGLIAVFFALWFIKIALVTWFKKYKLQYLLRGSLLVFLVVDILNFLHGYGIVFHEKYDSYSDTLWYLSGTLSGVMLVVRYFWKLPLNIKKTLYEVGFDHRKRQEAIARYRMRKGFETLDPASMPPVFPNGWIAVVESSEVCPGEVVAATTLGYRFCVFRSRDNNSAFVLDAYCPHLGADLTGGIVRGNTIECPFHGWCASGIDGSCTRGRDSENKPPVPETVKVKKWTSDEANGMIYVWHHAEKDKQEPYWEMPRVEEVCNGDWVFRGRTEHEVHCHIQEIPENGADINHLKQLHSASVFMGGNWMDTNSWFNFVTHHWQPEWTRDENVPHIARIKLKQTTSFLGYHIPFSRLDIDIEQIGPATVHLHIKSWFGRAILLQHIIPEGPLAMRVIHQLYTEPSVRPFPAELLIRAEAIMFERHIALMELKQCIKQRLQVTENCPIRKYQRWYFSEFFSQNSPTLLSLRDRTLEF